jgi:hypothetical protein
MMNRLSLVEATARPKSTLFMTSSHVYIDPTSKEMIACANPKLYRNGMRDIKGVCNLNPLLYTTEGPALVNCCHKGIEVYSFSILEGLGFRRGGATFPPSDYCLPSVHFQDQTVGFQVPETAAVRRVQIVSIEIAQL